MVHKDRMNELLSQSLQDIIDDLQPLLSGYQAIFYMFLFRHSHVKNGAPLVRISATGLRGVVLPTRGGKRIALAQIRDSLGVLERFGAIRREAEPNRFGTLYRVLLPREIQACLDLRAKRTAASLPDVSPSEVDYYNVRENRLKVFDRDDYQCRYCGKQLTQTSATLDHVIPVSSGGGNHLDNLVTACVSCNSHKQKHSPADFLRAK